MTISERQTVAEASLQGLYTQNEARIIVELLICHLTNFSSIDLRLNKDLEWDVALNAAFDTAMKQLQENRPIQYVIGNAHFYGLKFKVDESVLIPRPETEELVQLIIEFCKNNFHNNIRILEIGSGSGCIAISLKKYISNAEVVSVDISSDALEIARFNANENQVDIDFRLIDFLNKNYWESLGNDFDIIVSNPPYILPEESKQMEAHVLDYEPSQALFVTNKDPLQFYRAIAEYSNELGLSVKHIFFELNQNFAFETKQLFDEYGWQSSIKIDINDNPRILECHR